MCCQRPADSLTKGLPHDKYGTTCPYCDRGFHARAECRSCGSRIASASSPVLSCIAPAAFTDPYSFYSCRLAGQSRLKAHTPVGCRIAVLEVVHDGAAEEVDRLDRFRKAVAVDYGDQNVEQSTVSNLLKTLSQNLASSVCSIHNPSTSLRPSARMPNARYTAWCRCGGCQLPAQPRR